MPDTCFDQKYASIYDLIYRAKPYAKEVSVCEDKMGIQPGQCRRILDYGCGTGNHAKHWLNRGHHLIGIDKNSTMLELVRKKFPNAENHQWLNLEQKEQVAKGTIDGVCMLFDVFSYLEDEPEIRSTLSFFHKVLKPAGSMIFDFWYKDAVVHLKPEKRIATFSDDQTIITRITMPHHVPIDERVDIQFDIKVSSTEESAFQFEEHHRMRYYDQPTIERLLKVSGFSNVHFFTWDTPDNAPTPEAWSIVCYAEKVKL